MPTSPQSTDIFSRALFCVLLYTLLFTHTLYAQAIPPTLYESTREATLSPRSSKVTPARAELQGEAQEEGEGAPELTSESEGAAPAQDISAWRRGAGAGLALIPGVLISGGGHWVVGRNKEAKRLFWLKLSSLASLLTSGAVVASAGASEYVTPWGVPMILTSALSFVSVTLLDLTGALSEPQRPSQALRGLLTPQLRSGEQGSFELQGGYRRSATRPDHALWGLSWAHRLEGNKRRSRGRSLYVVKLSGADEQVRGSVAGAWALRARRAWSSWAQLSYVGHHNTRADVMLHQLELTSRWESSLGALIGPSLSALRGQLWFGWAGGILRYPLGDNDGTSAILGGLTLTHHSLSDRLRVSVGYDHRHDGWEGGALLYGLGSGVPGFVHTSLHARLTDQLWLGARGAWGSTHLYTLNVGWGL